VRSARSEVGTETATQVGVGTAKMNCRSGRSSMLERHNQNESSSNLYKCTLVRIQKATSIKCTYNLQQADHVISVRWFRRRDQRWSGNS